MIKTTQEIMEDVKQLRLHGEKVIIYPVDIISEICVSMPYFIFTNVKLRIEWRNRKTGDIYKFVSCNYDDYVEIEKEIDYIRNIAIENRLSFEDMIKLKLYLSAEDIEYLESITGNDIDNKQDLRKTIMTILQTKDWLTFFARMEAGYRLKELGMDPISEKIDRVAEELVRRSEQWIDSDAICKIVKEYAE